MTIPFRQFALLAQFLALVPCAVGAQGPVNPDSARGRESEAGVRTALVRPMPAGVSSRAECAPTPLCPVSGDESSPQGDDVSRRRARYALVGFLVGAGAGWAFFLRACSSEDCYSLLPGLFLGAAGGLLGMVVGLLVGPTP